MSAKQKQEEEKELSAEKSTPKESVSLSKEKKQSALDLFKVELEKVKDAEERLKMAIEFMRNSISQSKTPRFKDFWEAKKLCLPLFKEKINPALKAKFWTEYTELSTEAKRLKDILDEQSSFSMEQLELALKALENEVQDHEKMIATLPQIKFQEHASTLLKNEKSYDDMQRHVSYYMTLSARIKDLRKEIISTEMRIRHKNKLLKKLSEIGDLFIPKKKELIKKISEAFLKDVNEFARTHFDLDTKTIRSKDVPLFKLREEIKAFQTAAKTVSLNSSAFSSSRGVLSSCWDCVKEADKERKKSFHEKREAFKKNVDDASALLVAFEKELEESAPKSKSEVFDKASEVSKNLKEIPLLKEDVKVIRSKLKEIQDKALAPFESLEKEHEIKKQEAKQKREQQKLAFKDRCKKMILESSAFSLKEFQDLYESFDQKKKELKISEREKFIFGALKRELYESLLLKEVDEIVDPEEQREELEALFKKWENFKEETRARLEAFRKEMGSSGFDFEKAMVFRDHIDEEKKRLDRATEKVEELEEKLDS